MRCGLECGRANEREEETLKDIVMNIQQGNLPTQYIFKGQLQHILLLACLVPGALYLANLALGDGTFLGISDQKWFYAAITLPLGSYVLCRSTRYASNI